MLRNAACKVTHLSSIYSWTLVLNFEVCSGDFPPYVGMSFFCPFLSIMLFSWFYAFCHCLDPQYLEIKKKNKEIKKKVCVMFYEINH